MNKVTVKFATRLRGFFKQLATSPYLKFKIIIGKSNLYETNSKYYNIKVRLARSRIADWFGLIQRVNFDSQEGIDIIGSYNRFVKTDLPYFIYVENPTALYHYTLNRAKTYLGKRHINSFINDPNLKALIFMSKACEDTFEKLVGKIPPHIHCKQIYPLIPINKYATSSIESRPIQSTRFLFIAQGIRFFSKGGAEVIDAFEKLAALFPQITLTVVTQINIIPKETIERLENHLQIRLKEFNLNQDEMQQLYADSDVLLQPTSDDSFGLTILEALHSGLAIIASSLYSIPEIVKDGYNGFLVDPHYWFFSQGSNMPNPDVWDHRKKTIYSGKISKRLTDNLIEKMEVIITYPDVLLRFKHNSLQMSQNPPFSEKFIAEQWNDLIEKIKSAYNK